MNLSIISNSTIAVPNAQSGLISFLSTTSGRVNYFFVLIFPTSGVILSFFSLLIFSRPALNKTNMGFLYMWQSSIDILLLLIFIFETRSATLFGQSVANHAEVLCRSLRWFRRVTLHASSWMSVYITLDRFAYVCQPKRLEAIRNKKSISTCIILGMLLILTAINIPNYFSTIEITIQPISSNSSSNASRAPVITQQCRTNAVMSSLTNLMSTLFRTWLPILSMVLLDLLIIKRLNANKLKVTKGSKSLHRKENHYTKNVILLNLLFFIFNAPLAVIYLIDAINVYTPSVPKDPLYIAIISFLISISVNLSYAYQSASFFIYLIFNSVFRNELFFLLGIRSVKIFQTEMSHSNTMNSNSVNPRASQAMSKKANESKIN
jgi:hypothetical protein